MKPKLIIKASGTGTTFTALVEAEQKLLLDMNIQGLIVDRECGAADSARAMGVPLHIVSYAEDKGSFASRLLGKVNQLKPDYILLAGFLRKVPDEIVYAFHNRIFNTHPSLLPEFGGTGMYGRNVHNAVIEAGKKVSGISFHHVTDSYDQGGVIAKKEVPVAADETPQSLEEKIKRIEKFFIIEQLNALAARWRREAGTVVL